jgi:hypothetical protein
MSPGLRIEVMRLCETERGLGLAGPEHGAASGNRTPDLRITSASGIGAYRIRGTTGAQFQRVAQHRKRVRNTRCRRFTPRTSPSEACTLLASVTRRRRARTTYAAYRELIRPRKCRRVPRPDHRRRVGPTSVGWGDQGAEVSRRSVESGRPRRPSPGLSPADAHATRSRLQTPGRDRTPFFAGKPLASSTRA